VTSLDYTVIVLYLVGTVLVGGWFGRGQTTLREFFLGDRNIPWWAAAFSGIATIVSGAAFLGGPGQAFKSDFTFLQYRLAAPFAAAVICVILIPFFYKLDVYTAYEYLERRFDLKTRIMASGLFLLLKALYLGLVIYAPSLVVAEMTGLPLVWIVIGTGLLTTCYTMLGGMRAVIWTDTLQLVVLLGSLVGSLALLVHHIGGGMTGFIEQASAYGKLRFLDLSFSLESEVTLWGGLFGGLVLTLGQYGVDQAELQRFLTTSSIRKSRFAMLSAMICAAALGFLLFLVGAALFVFYAQNPAKGGMGMNPDRVFPKFIIEELPAGMTGLVIAGVFAASMSTISAVLNSLTTVTLSDFYTRLGRRQASLRTARWVTLAFGVVCTGVALYAQNFGTILAATSKISSFFGGTLVGIFLLGMLNRRATGSGAFMGALVAFAGVAVVSVMTPISWMWYGLISAVIAFVMGWALSLLFPAPAPERIFGLTMMSRRSPGHAESI